MACSGCKQKQQQEQQRMVVQRQRSVVVNNNTNTIVQPEESDSQTMTINLTQQPASEKFQIPRILPPLNR